MTEHIDLDRDLDLDVIWEYFTPVMPSFWNWSEDQQAIVWTSGETIVFRAELAALMQVLLPIGLPPLDAVLLVIATCRSSAATTLPQLAEVWKFDQFPMQHSLTSQLGNLRGELWVLSNLPTDLRGSLDGKQAILTLVAENGPGLTTSAFAKHCIEWLLQGYSIENGPDVVRHARTTGEWSVFLRGLQDGLASVNEAAVRLRLRTGLEPVDIPQPIPLVLPESVSVPRSIKDLLKELEQDPEHCGLFRIVKRLLSVLTLPRPLSAPSDQAQGGVSDITNRGPFDRLLLSELAHDVDVLMTRVALNEALYIRREIPPTIPPRNRLVLLDAGIRMWGLPRLYSAAVSLALAATQDDSVSTRIFRAEDHAVVPIELNSREEYLAHLEVLELAAHPGRALPAFLNEGEGALADFVIVTGEDVLADPEFRLCLTEQKFPELYLVIVNRQGSLKLIHRTRQGERILKQVLLDLEQILQLPAPTKLKLRDSGLNPDLPAIMHVSPFPLLLSHKIEWNNTGDVSFSDRPKAMVALTSDRRLMLWTSKTTWARQLCDRLPSGNLIWHSANSDDSGVICVIVGYLESGKLHFVTANREGTVFSIVQLPSIQGRIRGVCEFAGIIHVILQDQTRLYSATDGKLLGAATLVSEFEWIRDRFYKGAAGCYVLAFDGRSAVWQMVLTREQLHPVVVKSMFDCRKVSAPIVVTTWNLFLVTGSLEKLEFQSKYGPAHSAKIPETNIGSRSKGFSNLQVTWISQDGNQVKLSEPVVVNAHRRCWNVDLTTRTATDTTEVRKTTTSNTDFRVAHSGNLRSRFVMVGVHLGMLVLMTARQKFVSMSYEPWAKRIRLVPLQVNRSDLAELVGFKIMTVAEGVGYELKVATWQNGSRIYLDSRGLLHLRSLDDTIPELTLVLHDSQISGWTDRNEVWGDIACLGFDKERISPEKVYKVWLVPFCAQR